MDNLNIRSEFRTRCEFSKERDRIYLFSEDRELLDRIQEVLQAYTTTIEPTLELKSRKVKKISGEYRVNIHDILPRFVARNFNGSWLRRPDRFTRFQFNCHGAALLCSGMNPLLTFEWGLPSEFSKEMMEIDVKDVAPGDFISMRGKDHSFVYLSPEFCLSKNGRSAEEQLKLCRTEDVLKWYKGAPDCLETGEDIRVFRRKTRIDWFESIENDLLEFPILRERAIQTVPPWEAQEIPRLIKILDSFKDRVTNLLQQSDMTESQKKLLISIYCSYESYVSYLFNDVSVDNPIERSESDLLNLAFPKPKVEHVPPKRVVGARPIPQAPERDDTCIKVGVACTLAFSWFIFNTLNLWEENFQM